MEKKREGERALFKTKYGMFTIPPYFNFLHWIRQFEIIWDNPNSLLKIKFFFVNFFYLWFLRRTHLTPSPFPKKAKLSQNNKYRKKASHSKERTWTVSRYTENKSFTWACILQQYCWFIIAPFSSLEGTGVLWTLTSLDL